MMEVVTLLLFQLLILLVFSPLVLGHEAGITDTSVDISRDSLIVTYTVPNELLNELEGTVEETTAEAVTPVVADGFDVRNNERPCSGVVNLQRLLETIDSTQFVIRYQCSEPITQLNLGYSLFFAADAKHSNILRVSILGRSLNRTLSASKNTFTLDVKSIVMQVAEARNSEGASEVGNSHSIRQSVGLSFFPVGFEHIVFGFDHVLFLICLVLLPMRLLSTFALVTSFTVAHSITLTLSVLDVLTLQPRFVEAVIALSIVYVSLRTIVILHQVGAQPASQTQVRERIANGFIFGLVHGFGFSYLLKEIGLGDQAFASLLFFNLGVEAGQLLILVFLLPAIWLLGKACPSWRWASAASAVTGLVGLFWLVKRVVGV